MVWLRVKMGCHREKILMQCKIDGNESYQTIDRIYKIHIKGLIRNPILRRNCISANIRRKKNVMWTDNWPPTFWGSSWETKWFIVPPRRPTQFERISITFVYSIISLIMQMHKPVEHNQKFIICKRD